MGPTEWASLLVLSVLWGAAFFFYKVLDDAGLPPFTIAFGRALAGAVALLPVVVADRSQAALVVELWASFAVLGALNNVIPFSLIAFGETHIVSGLAAIYNATTPLFTALIAHAVTRDEKLTAQKIAGIAIGLGRRRAHDGAQRAARFRRRRDRAARLRRGCGGVRVRRDLRAPLSRAGSRSDRPLDRAAVRVDCRWRCR